MKKVYKTKGTCSIAIETDVDDNGYIQNVSFVGGCNGNTNGISALVKGEKAEDVIAKLEGIRCGMRPTSCPDQLARALREILQNKG